MSNVQLSVCSYQSPQAKNEIYNWFIEHLKEICFFHLYNEVEIDKLNKIMCTKFLFALEKSDSGKIEIVFCLPNCMSKIDYDITGCLREIKQKLEELSSFSDLINHNKIIFSKLLLFGSFTSSELNSISINFKI